jgi:hypothetical protein
MDASGAIEEISGVPEVVRQVMKVSYPDRSNSIFAAF